MSGWKSADLEAARRALAGMRDNKGWNDRSRARLTWPPLDRLRYQDPAAG